MTCSIDWPCGRSLRLESKTETHAVYACLNGHHFLVGQPPRLAPKHGQPLTPGGRPKDEDDGLE